MYRLNQFSRSDLSMYFSDTYMKYRQSGGTEIRVMKVYGLGERNSFEGIDNESGDSINIPTSRMVWDGLEPPKCVGVFNRLFFLAPSGDKHYKKTPTINSLMGFYINGTRKIPYPGNLPESSRNQIISRFLLIEYPCPDYGRWLLELGNHKVLAITSRAGIISKDKGYDLYVDGLLSRSDINLKTECSKLRKEYKSDE